MKIEVGMYVRSKNGAIAKAEQIVDDEIHFNIHPIFSDGEEIGYNWLYVKDITKASHNIIDLIEVGDYVNGYKVKEVYNPNEDETAILIIEINPEVIPNYLGIKEIKSIVTKEQFESMEYRIGN